MASDSSTSEQSEQKFLFEPDRRDLCRLFDEIQTCQAELAADLELGFFCASETWRRSRSVLDVGTGNGDYLAKLATQFPEKRYFGVDPNRDLINLAKERNRLPIVEFDALLFAGCSGHFDSIVARLLLQHLEDVSRFFEKASELVPLGGSIFVIDAADELRCFYPEPRDFLRFFQTYRNEQADLGLDRDIVGRLIEHGDMYPGWSLAERHVFAIPSTISGKLALFHRAYDLFLKIVKASGLSNDYTNVAERDWQSWCALTGAYTQIGLHWIRFERVA